MASLVWFVILTYAWHVFFKQTGTPNEIVKKKVAYFHISAWSIPLVLTTTVMAMTEVHITINISNFIYLFIFFIKKILVS